MKYGCCTQLLQSGQPIRKMLTSLAAAGSVFTDCFASAYRQAHDVERAGVKTHSNKMGTEVSAACTSVDSKGLQDVYVHLLLLFP